MTEPDEPDQLSLLDAEERSSSDSPPPDAADTVPAEGRNDVSDDSQQVAESPSPEAPTSLYYLTNRLNLISALSGRLIAPLASHRKHYVDLLDRWPGWVPLLTEPPPADLIDIVTSERGAGAPVIVEFPVEEIEATVPLERPIVLTVAVPLRRATAIHFRDERSLREHRARGFGNVHPHDALLRVTPELFDRAVSTTTVTVEAPPAPDIDWFLLDCIRGAISAGIVGSRSGEDLGMAAELLGATGVSSDLASPEWLRSSDITATRRPGSSDKRSADALLFRTAFEVLIDVDATEAWRPQAILDSISAKIDGQERHEEASARIASGLEVIRDVLDVRREFVPFEDEEVLTAAQSLLLVLLRPGLGDLLAWDPADTGVGPAGRLGSRLLAGCLRGLAREATESRSMALDDLTAEWMARVARGAEDGLRLTFVPTRERTEVRSDADVLWSASPLVAKGVAAYLRLDERARADTRLRLSESLGWPTRRTVTVTGVLSLQKSDDTAVIVTDGDVDVSTGVDEAAFLDRLSDADEDVQTAAVAAAEECCASEKPRAATSTVPEVLEVPEGEPASE